MVYVWSKHAFISCIHLYVLLEHFLGFWRACGYACTRGSAHFIFSWARTACCSWALERSIKLRVQVTLSSESRCNFRKLLKASRDLSMSSEHAERTNEANRPPGRQLTHRQQAGPAVCARPPSWEVTQHGGLPLLYWDCGDQLALLRLCDLCKR